MAWRESYVKKVWTAISKRGLREGLQDVAVRWARGRIAEDVMGKYGWVLNPDCRETLASPGFGPLRINWLIPSIDAPGSGGLFNIFRTIQHLEQWGHHQRIYRVGASVLSEDGANTLMREYYFPMNTRIEAFGKEVADSDALVAVTWQTAYVARSLGNTARKFYFVQDLENLFFEPGSLYEFARETYRWGFHGITAGRWIADVLRQEFCMESSTFGFSYDHATYFPRPRLESRESKRRVLMYARPNSPRRGFELGILALSLVAKAMPDVEFVLVGFPPRSLGLPFPVSLPGILNPVELGELYRKTSVALVLSHTNLSLLPLELMACGCPVVSNSGPNVDWLLTDRVAQLASSTPEALAQAVLLLLGNDRLREQKAAAGLAFAQGTNWMTEIKKIEAAFYEGLKIRRAANGNG